MFKWLFGKKDDGGASEVSGTKDLLNLSRRIELPVDRAFALFVDRFDSWWPRDMTLGKDNTQSVAIEPRMNGRCIETGRDGSKQTFGTVLAFDRPSHIVIAWQIRPDLSPEPEPGAASRIDVRFSPEGDGATRLVLVHRDFFRHGDGWERYKAEFAAKKGWPRLVEAYAAAAAGK